jgi:redox-regulated HSP33 family molecular chaperone
MKTEKQLQQTLEQLHIQDMELEQLYNQAVLDADMVAIESAQIQRQCLCSIITSIEWVLA